MGLPCLRLDGQQVELEGVWPNRGLEEQTDERLAPIPVTRRHLAEADLGRRSPQGGPAGGDQREYRRIQGNPRGL